MNKKNPETLPNILRAAKDEFLNNGYKEASMRTIAKKANVTFGAIYGYYPDKKALFDALVSEHADYLRKLLADLHQKFESMPTKQKSNDMIEYSGNGLHRLLDYIYDHFDAFKLIICCSAGTEYENYIDSLVEIEAEGTKRFTEAMKAEGYHLPQIKPELSHMLGNAYFSGMFETVVHDMKKEDAVEHLDTLIEFFNAGWERIMGVVSHGKESGV